MQFIWAKDWSEPVTAVSARLVAELSQGKRVLWLLSGGSQVKANTQIMDEIDAELSQNLTVGLIDERYGPVGHADSNWAQLLKSGFYPKQAKVIPALVEFLEKRLIIERYEHKIKVAMADNDFILGSLGIGPDGHTAGILPAGPAAEETDKYTLFYESEPFVRITLSFFALRQLNVAYAMCFGEAKRAALERLAGDKQVSLSEEPAQILKEISESYIYNDVMGKPE